MKKIIIGTLLVTNFLCATGVLAREMGENTNSCKCPDACAVDGARKGDEELAVEGNSGKTTPKKEAKTK